MKQFLVITNADALAFAAEHKLTIAIPVNNQSLHVAINEMARDNVATYYGGAFIEIGGSTFQVFYF